MTNRGMRTFTTIWFGQLISTLGSGLTGFALGIWIYEETGSATLFAISMLVWILPNILLSPVAGVIADRWDRRIVMILSDSMAGAATLFIFAVLSTGLLKVWHIYFAQVFFSAANTFQWPAYSAATSLMVPKEQLGRAGGMSQIGQAISTLASPAIAGALFVTAGLQAILLIDALTFLFALGTLVAVRFPQPAATKDRDKPGSFFQEALYGWKYIRARAGLFSLLIVFAGMNFLFSMVFPLITPMLLEMASPDVVGYVNSSFGVGTMAGTLVMSAWGGPKRRIYGIVLGEALTGLSVLLMGIGMGLSIPIVAVAGFGMMFAMPISNGCSQAIWQSKVAPDVQGRVFAARTMIAFSIMPVSYLLAGPLSDLVFDPLLVTGGPLAGSLGRVFGVGPGRGTSLMFVLWGMLYMLLVLAILTHPRIRRLEIEIPDTIS